MLIQTSLQILPLNLRGPGWEDGSLTQAAQLTLPSFMVQAGLCHKVQPLVLIPTTWFCRKFPSSFPSSLDPAQPGKKVEFQEQLTGTKTSLAADRRKNKRTRSAKAFRIQAGVPQRTQAACLQDSRAMQCRGKGQQRLPRSSPMPHPPDKVPP